MKIDLSGNLGWEPKFAIGDLVEVQVGESKAIGVIWNYFNNHVYEIELHGEPKKIVAYFVKRKVDIEEF